MLNIHQQNRMFDNLPEHYIVSFWGAPRSGKSYCIKYFLSYLYQKKLADVVIVFTSTLNNGDYAQYVDSKYIMRYDEKKLQAVWNQAAKLKGKKILIVMDDILGSVKWKSDFINEFFANHRHHNISILISAQYITALPPFIRDYTSLAIIFHHRNGNARKNSHYNFGQDLGTVTEWTNYLNRLLNYKFSFILVDNLEAELDKKYRIMRCPATIHKFFFKNYI